MTLEQTIFLFGTISFVGIVYIIHKGYLDEKEKEDKKTYIQTIGGIKFVINDEDEIFRKENETIIVDKLRKLKHTIPNTSILYIQEGTEKN